MKRSKTIMRVMIPACVWILGAGQAAGQSVIAEIIDVTGDGAGNDLGSPFAIAVDGAGNVFVAGFDSANVFKITPAGVITQIIDATGDGTGTLPEPCPDGRKRGCFRDYTGEGLLVGPEAIAVDPAGNVYVAGYSSANAFKITPAGVITEIIDVTGDGAGNGLELPRGIAVDAAGNVYVAGSGSNNVFKITPAGVITQIIDATGDGVGNMGDLSFRFDTPTDIAVDAAGNVYVTGSFSANAFKITPAGVITQIIDATGDGTPNNEYSDGAFGMAVDGAGNAYVASGGNLFKITPGGAISRIFDFFNTRPDGNGQPIDASIGMAVDAAGNVYVTAPDSDNAFKITPAGVITEIINCTGDRSGDFFLSEAGDCLSTLGNNDLNDPVGIAVDAAGNVYVVGAISDNAFKITPGGVSDESPDANGGDGTSEMDPTMDDEPPAEVPDESPDADGGDGTGNMDPIMDDGPTGAGATPALCGAAMIGTFFMTLLGLLSLSSAYRRGYVLPRR